MSLAPGFYELTQDVTNPHPDRRRKVWHKLVTIPKGTKFVLIQTTYPGPNDGDVMRTVQELTQLGYPYDRIKVGMSRGYPEDYEIALAVIPYLEKRAETVRTLYALFGWESYHTYAVPQALYEMGKITLDDLRQAHAFLENEGGPLDVLVDEKP